MYFLFIILAYHVYIIVAQVLIIVLLFYIRAGERRVSNYMEKKYFLSINQRVVDIIILWKRLKNNKCYTVPATAVCYNV